MVLNGNLDGLGVDSFAVFDVADLVVQDIPDDDCDLVGDGPDGFVVAEANNQFTKDHLQVAALGADGRFGFFSCALGFMESCHKLLATAFKFLSHTTSFGLVSKDLDKSDGSIGRVMYDR